MLTFDTTKTLDQFKGLASSMNYLISKTANDIAFLDTRKAASKQMESDFIIRSKNITKSYMFKVERANKNNLIVKLEHKVLGIGFQQFGGTETPNGKSLAIPNRESIERNLGISTNKLIPKKFGVAKILSKARKVGDRPAVAKVGKNSLMVRHNGIFILKDSGLQAIYHFVDKASHNKKPFNLQEIMIKSFNQRFARRFNVNYLKQIKKG